MQDFDLCGSTGRCRKLICARWATKTVRGCRSHGLAHRQTREGVECRRAGRGFGSRFSVPASDTRRVGTGTVGVCGGGRTHTSTSAVGERLSATRQRVLDRHATTAGSSAPHAVRRRRPSPSTARASCRPPRENTCRRPARDTHRRTRGGGILVLPRPRSALPTTPSGASKPLPIPAAATAPPQPPSSPSTPTLRSAIPCHYGSGGGSPSPSPRPPPTAAVWRRRPTTAARQAGHWAATPRRGSRALTRQVRRVGRARR